MTKTVKQAVGWLAAATIGGALLFAPAANAAPGHEPPAPSPGTQSVSGADPNVPFGVSAPGDEVPYDPYIKNPGGGVDLPS
jgi:hypothetical protein